MHISKKNLTKNLREEAWTKFSDKMKIAGSSQELINCLGNFLTSDEIIVLEKRLAIPILLGNGLSYRKIGEMIDVSSTTISFVKNKLKRKPVVHRKRSPDISRKPKKELPMFPPRVGYRRWFYEKSKR